MTATGDNRHDRPDEALSTLASQLAGEVLADAVPEARRRARDRLVDLLVDAIVEAAMAGRTPRTPVSATEPGLPSDESSPEQALYVYAVTRAALGTPSVVGVDGGPVVAVEHGDLALLVSHIVPDLLEGLDREPVTEDGRLATLARRHDGVVAAAFDQGSVLPLRFGTLLRDDRAARQLLTARYSMLDEQLQRLAGHAEYGLRVVESAPDVGSDDRSAVSPDAARRPDHDDRGTTYLAQRRDELADREEQRRRIADVLAGTHDRLAEHALDSVRGRRAPHEGVLFEAAYLVPDGRKGDFLTAAERASEVLAGSDLDLSVRGPVPPYSFARVELDSEAAHE